MVSAFAKQRNLTRGDGKNLNGDLTRGPSRPAFDPLRASPAFSGMSRSVFLSPRGSVGHLAGSLQRLSRAFPVFSHQIPKDSPPAREEYEWRWSATGRESPRAPHSRNGQNRSDQLAAGHRGGRRGQTGRDSRDTASRQCPSSPTRRDRSGRHSCWRFLPEDGLTPPVQEPLSLVRCRYLRRTVGLAGQPRQYPQFSGINWNADGLGYVITARQADLVVFSYFSEGKRLLWM
jgi:hypothetical protein